MTTAETILELWKTDREEAVYQLAMYLFSFGERPRDHPEWPAYSSILLSSNREIADALLTGSAFEAPMARARKDAGLAEPMPQVPGEAWAEFLRKRSAL